MITDILILHAKKFKEINEIKKEIKNYINSFDKEIDRGSENLLIDTYKSMYNERADYRSDSENWYDDTPLLSFYEDIKNPGVSYEDIEKLHNLFCRRKLLNREMSYIKRRITVYANKLLAST